MRRASPTPRRRAGRPVPAVPVASSDALVRLGVPLVIALALALRLWGVRLGLPDFLDEAIPFRKALGMWDPVSGAVDWDPHFFHYPSLTLDLNLLLQQAHLALGRMLGWFAGPADYAIAFQTDPTAMVVPARALSIAFDALGIGCVAVLGERMRRGAGVLAALMLACSPVLMECSRTIQSDTFMMALVVAAVERMLAWRRHGGARLAVAAVLVGLAAGAKYPGAVALLPLALVLWSRDGARGLARWPLHAALAATAFLVTTPYAVLDRSAFLSDLGFVSHVAAGGHFGDLDRAGLSYQAHKLVGDLGWVAVALLAASAGALVLGLLGRRGPSAAARVTDEAQADRAVLWTCVLAFGVPIAVAHVEVERYLVPVLPFAALLAAEAALALGARLSGRARAAVVAALVVAMVAPALRSGLRAAGSDPYASRGAARRWLESHLTRHDLLLQEVYAAPVLERLRAGELRASAVFAAASPRWRAAYEARPTLAAVMIPLAVVGTTSATMHPLQGPPITLTVVPHPGDLNQVVYDPRLLDGVDVVVTSSAVRGRFEADPARYPVPRGFYALLDSTAEVAARFGAEGGDRGPVLTIYRLGPRTRAAVAALGPLPPLWWTERVSPGYRVAYDRALAPPGMRGVEAPLSADGEPAPWVGSLRGLFAERYARFAQWMAMELLERGAPEPARRLAAAVATMEPDDVTACLTLVDASIQLGAWNEALQALGRTERALEGRSEVPGLLRLQRAGVLQHLGDLAAARAELEIVRYGPDPELAARAARALSGPR